MVSFLKKKTPDKAQKKNWYTDRYQSVLVQRNLLSIFSIISLLFSLVAIILVYSNIPIVTVEPFVIQVEPRSGITQVVNNRTSEELTAQESINNYFVVQYIRARETIDSQLARNFEAVRLMSEPRDIFPVYAWGVNPNNPESFLARTAGSAGAMAPYREIKIKSITRLGEEPHCTGISCKVQVRVLVREVTPRATKELHRIVYMEYTFVDMRLTIEERQLNPLGFRVTTYRVNEESQ